MTTEETKKQLAKDFIEALANEHDKRHIVEDLAFEEAKEQLAKDMGLTLEEFEQRLCREIASRVKELKDKENNNPNN